MKAVVISYRRGRHTQYNNQVIVEVEGVDDREKAASLVGKKVEWTTPGGKKLKGVVVAPHGNNGRVRVRFEKGVPGQMIGSTVTIR